MDFSAYSDFSDYTNHSDYSFLRYNIIGQIHNVSNKKIAATPIPKEQSTIVTLNSASFRVGTGMESKEEENGRTNEGRQEY